MSDVRNHVERVARALAEAHTEVVFGESNEEAFLRLAQAAIDALQLTEEWAEQTQSGFVHGRYYSREDAQAAIAERKEMYPNPSPSKPVSRLVGPWSQQGGEQ